MKKTVLLFTLTLAAVAAVAQNENDTLLRFKTMFGVDGPYVSTFTPPTPLRGLNGAPGPWSIEKAQGIVKTDGTVSVHVRGLIIPSLGRNPVPNFRAVVSCRSVDGTGNANIVNVSTPTFPASTAGDSDIEAQVDLPEPCLAPLVFVTSPGLVWFSVTGN